MRLFIVDGVVLTPDEGKKELQIERRGNLATRSHGTNEEVVCLRSFGAVATTSRCKYLGCGGGI